MLIELQHLFAKDIIEVKKWIMENSPDSELFAGYINVDREKTWLSINWENIEDTASIIPIIPDGFFTWAVDIPDKDAVLFKLVWG